jgi:peptide/nickel transport system substrate-binding protein
VIEHIARGLNALALVTILVAAQPVAAADTVHSWSVAGTLRIGLSDAPNTLDPILATQVSETFLATLGFDGLVRTHQDGSIEPALAVAVPSLENRGISADGRTIVYHLRHGVQWQDGYPFTSADVAFSQRARLNPQNSVTLRAPYDAVVKFDTPDEFMVVVHLAKPFAPFITEWFPDAVLPAHLLARAASLNQDAFNAAPIGTGPFRLLHWTRGSKIEYEANPAYYAGAPKLKHVHIAFYPDENSQEIALRTHEIDWFFLVSPSAYRAVSADSDIRTVQVAANAFYGLRINVAHPPLDDVAVRRAILLAVDRAALASKIGAGLVDPAVADIPAFTWAYDPALKAAPYDPAGARKLLQSAGWVIGLDGIAAKNGKRLSLVLVYGAGASTAMAVTLQVQAMLRSGGIEVVLKSEQPNVLFAPVSAGGTLRSGSFDLAWNGYLGYNDPDDSRFFSCKALAPNGDNVGRWCISAIKRRAMMRLRTMTVQPASATTPQSSASCSMKFRKYSSGGLTSCTL